jgi:DNA-binding response OmpR family regulator
MRRHANRERVHVTDAPEKVAEVGRVRPVGHVLIVESDPDLQWKLARTLTVRGQRVVGTSSAEGALALLQEWHVDLALVAEDLPGMDGLSLAKKVRDMRPEIPVVLLAEDGPEVQIAARLAGAVACLVKPFRLEALKDVLEPLLALRMAPAE